eukprot:m.193523 g.193523  ORF g.193523 m.193523 type:complete len:422 (+) comp18294_c1_seq1:358-1623(+)
MMAGAGNPPAEGTVAQAGDGAGFAHTTLPLLAVVEGHDVRVDAASVPQLDRRAHRPRHHHHHLAGHLQAHNLQADSLQHGHAAASHVHVPPASHTYVPASHVHLHASHVHLPASHVHQSHSHHAHLPLARHQRQHQHHPHQQRQHHHQAAQAQSSTSAPLSGLFFASIAPSSPVHATTRNPPPGDCSPPIFYTERDDVFPDMASELPNTNALRPTRSDHNRQSLPQPASLRLPFWSSSAVRHTAMTARHAVGTTSPLAVAETKDTDAFDMRSLANQVAVYQDSGFSSPALFPSVPSSDCIAPRDSPRTLRKQGARCRFETMLASSSESLLSSDAEVCRFPQRRRMLQKRRLTAPRARSSSITSTRSEQPSFRSRREQPRSSSRSSFRSESPVSMNSSCDGVLPLRRAFVPFALLHGGVDKA